MKHTAMLLLLLAVSLAFANPVWTEDVVVREAQDLSYTGCTQQADDGSLITLWTQILDGENCLIANRISAVGEEMWDSPLRIAGCGLGIGGEQMKRPPVSVANRLSHPWAPDPGSSTLAHDDTVYSLVGSVSGSGGLVSTIPPFHLFTKYLE